MTGPAGMDLSGAEFLRRPGVACVLALLNGEGEAARVVGGAVRNHLMGLPISDIDIATTCLPAETMRRAAAAGVHAVPTGFDHGTVTLIVGGVPHEVTTLREDIETDGRHAVVRYGRDFRADALRRDFTINALSVGPDGRLHDDAGGLADIAARRVRFIGAADQRIAEDFLRILRFFRFSASYGGGALEAEGLAAARRNREGLAGLSRERIRQETLKLIVAPHAAPVVATMAADGFLAPVLAGPADPARFARLAALEARLSLPADAVRRLAALALAEAGDVARLRAALRLTNAETRALEGIAEARAGFDGLSAGAPSCEAALRALLYRLGPETYRDAVLDHGARHDSGAEAELWARLPARWRAPRFVLTGKDALALGVSKGPAVGRLLAEAEACWISAGMPAEEEAQRAILSGLSVQFRPNGG